MTQSSSAKHTAKTTAEDVTDKSINVIEGDDLKCRLVTFCRIQMLL